VNLVLRDSGLHSSGIRPPKQLNCVRPSFSLHDALPTNPWLLACQSVIPDFAPWASPHQSKEKVVELTSGARLDSWNRHDAKLCISKWRSSHKNRDKLTEIESIFRGLGLQISGVPGGASQHCPELPNLRVTPSHSKVYVGSQAILRSDTVRLFTRQTSFFRS
jgi:hypothetical protein